MLVAHCIQHNQGVYILISSYNKLVIITSDFKMCQMWTNVTYTVGLRVVVTNYVQRNEKCIFVSNMHHNSPDLTLMCKNYTIIEFTHFILHKFQT
jgi:hypothetical protein